MNKNKFDINRFLDRIYTMMSILIVFYIFCFVVFLYVSIILAILK